MEGEDTEVGFRSEGVQAGGRLRITEGFQRLMGWLLNLLVFKGDWLEDLQKKLLILGLSDEELVQLAYDRSAGSASEFIREKVCEQTPPR